MPKRPAPPVRAARHDDRNAITRSRQIENQQTEADFEDDAALIPGYLQRQLASWTTSMLIHMVMLVALALLVFEQDVQQSIGALILPPDELPADDLTTEPLDVPLVEPKELPETFEPELVEVDMADAIEAQETIEFQAAEPPSLALPQLAETGFHALLADQSLDGYTGDGYRNRKTNGRGFGTRGGGCGESQSAVDRALAWLARHQNRNGSWSFNHTAGGRCSGFANPGNKRSRMGATGLALLPFLGAGYTHQEGRYKEVVQKGLNYLVGNMLVADKAGRLFEADGSNHEHMYCHGIAACALAEAYGMTQDSKLRAPAQLSINYIVNAQDPRSGGWMYTPRTGGDTSVVGWQIMAIKSGVLSYLSVPGSTKRLATKWLDSVQSELPAGAAEGYGVGARYGYRAPGDRDGRSGACTAIGLLCRNYLGTKKEDPGLRMGVEWLGGQGPSPQDMYYNYYASMVMFQNDGPNGALWKKWNVAMRDSLVKSQVRAGRDRGSWHFTGNHGGSGGRLYNTALAAMTLEVYYRYLPIYQKENVERDDFPLE